MVFADDINDKQNMVNHFDHGQEWFILGLFMAYAGIVNDGLWMVDSGLFLMSTTDNDDTNKQEMMDNDSQSPTVQSCWLMIVIAGL